MNRGKDYIRRATRMDGSLDIEKLERIINLGFELADITNKHCLIYSVALGEIYARGGRKDAKTKVTRDIEWARKVASDAFDKVIGKRTNEVQMKELLK